MQSNRWAILRNCFSLSPHNCDHTVTCVLSVLLISVAAQWWNQLCASGNEEKTLMKASHHTTGSCIWPSTKNSSWNDAILVCVFHALLLSLHLWNDHIISVCIVHGFLLSFHYLYSSFDEYSSELKSGRLEWSPVHKSEKFWRENAVRLNEKNYELLKWVPNVAWPNWTNSGVDIVPHCLLRHVRMNARITLGAVMKLICLDSRELSGFIVLNFLIKN